MGLRFPPNTQKWAEITIRLCINPAEDTQPDTLRRTDEGWEASWDDKLTERFRTVWSIEAKPTAAVSEEEAARVIGLLARNLDRWPLHAAKACRDQQLDGRFGEEIFADGIAIEGSVNDEGWPIVMELLLRRPTWRPEQFKRMQVTLGDRPEDITEGIKWTLRRKRFS